MLDNDLPLPCMTQDETPNERMLIELTNFKTGIEAIIRFETIVDSNDVPRYSRLIQLREGTKVTVLDYLLSNNLIANARVGELDQMQNLLSFLTNLIAAHNQPR